MIGHLIRGLFLGLAAWVQAAGAAEPEQRLFHLQIFTVPKAEGLALLAQDLDDRQLHSQLAEKARTAPAVAEKTLLVATNSTEKTEMQQADELIYVTEFDPQQLPSQLAIGEAGLLDALARFFHPPSPPAPPPTPPPPNAQSAETGAASGGEPRAAVRQPATPIRHPANGGLGIITSITPTAFEMRPLGERLSLSPLSAAPSGEVDLEAEIESTRLAGFVTFNGEMQPQFRNRKITTRVTCRLNAPTLLGTCSAPAGTGTEFESREETLSLAFLTARSPQPPAEAVGQTIRFGEDMSATFEVLSLSKNEALMLLEDPSVAEPVLYARMRAALAAGSARLEACLCGRLNPGQKTTLAEVDEFIYPNEFDPPQMPTSLLIADDELLADLRAGRQVGTGIAPPQGNPHNGGFGLQTTVTPMGFETRQLGDQLIIDPILDGEGRMVTMDLRAELTRRIGSRTYAGLSQPVFESSWISTRTTVRIGVPHLIGTLNRPLNTGVKEGNQEDRLWFAFITLRKA